MILPIHFIWGFIPEIERGFLDMTNASNTYLSIAIGAVVPQKYHKPSKRERKNVSLTITTDNYR
jgi:hypothetical protein